MLIFLVVYFHISSFSFVFFLTPASEELRQQFTTILLLFSFHINSLVFPVFFFYFLKSSSFFFSFFFYSASHPISFLCIFSSSFYLSISFFNIDWRTYSLLDIIKYIFYYYFFIVCACAAAYILLQHRKSSWEEYEAFTSFLCSSTS